MSELQNLHILWLNLQQGFMTSLFFRSKFLQEKLSHWFDRALLVNLNPSISGYAGGGGGCGFAGYRQSTRWEVKNSPKGTTTSLYITCVCVLSGSVCPTLCDPVDCSPLGSSVHRIFQARILEWVAISYSKGSFWPRDWTQSLASPASTGRFFTTRATWAAYIVLSCVHRQYWWPKSIRANFSVLAYNLLSVLVTCGL